VRNGERYFGVDIDAGGIVVAERMDGRSLGEARYPAGAAAMTLAVALMAVEGIQVTMVSPQTIKEPAARAEQLARLAERLF